MSDLGEELDATRLRELFQELSDRLASRGLKAQLFVVGGAAMALEYDGDRLTRDVDAVFEPAADVRRIVEELGVVHNLPPDWINDGAKGFMPGQDEQPRIAFDSESLLVQVPSPEYLLAMKLHASRDERDLDDAARLFRIVGYSSAEEALSLLERTYSQSRLLPRHRYVIDDVVRRAALTADAPESSSTGSESGRRPRRSTDDMHGESYGAGPSYGPSI